MVIEDVSKHLPADGSVWITNNTKYHNFFNGGEKNTPSSMCVRKPVQEIMVEFTQGYLTLVKIFILIIKAQYLERLFILSDISQSQ